METDTLKGSEAAAQATAAMIRQSSAAGHLVSESEILHRLADQRPLTPDPAKGFEKILKKVVKDNEDLHELAARDGSRSYYSLQFMTGAYAMILLQKKDDPLRLIAESVRKDSAAYPRPVPLDIFTQPPFDLTPQAVLEYLERMSQKEEYRDIMRTTTSTSRVFLYSTLHLESDYASMLAEWLDVGQFNNP